MQYIDSKMIFNIKQNAYANIAKATFRYLALQLNDWPFINSEHEKLLRIKEIMDAKVLIEDGFLKANESDPLGILQLIKKVETYLTKQSILNDFNKFDSYDTSTEDEKTVK